MQIIWKRLRHHLGAFRRANAGNVAMTFALSSLPLVGTVGFAVDYSHANAVKAAMQAALDSTALMLSRDCSASIWMETRRQSGWPFWRSRREDDCRGATVTQAIFS